MGILARLHFPHPDKPSTWLLFGMLHGSRWPAGTLAGLLFGWLAMRQAKIGEAVAAHAAANALIAVYVLAAGQWQLW